ncbi:uncharacterized protein ASCRUDRAFT_73459 [Ascoidea rubescens DSM 1968]|uniref:Amino acid permease/ SLC12A domain-containing protein n=1 Tax=Ascoidea rubescens DSM 1968 TaxID=1344418 RepID=A0A1D2VPX1_9ASCO|nr:hypothetical protein ASCRUDRAFT_73459 [Ascoidea rubescens DSM 1968]ODV63646.1 hypothetical protein ASCRUDRAFT_73459 [Ascoidea rubescens DSM 1968]
MALVESSTDLDLLLKLDHSQKITPKRLINSFKKAEDGQQTLSPSLSSIHSQMIAIGGSIGTGLFIGTSQSLSLGGPASLLISYLFVGVMIYTTIQSLGELAVNFPLPGTFSIFSARFIDPSWGFTIGWNYCLQWLVCLPMELSAIVMTVNYWEWGQKISNAIIISAVFLLVVVINLLNVKVFGAVEVFSSCIKIFAVLSFILIAIVLVGIQNTNPEAINYWKTPGPFNNNFKGLATVLINACFSFAGTEMIGLTAAESKNVHLQLPKSTRQIFWRILVFYLITLTLVGLLVPYNDINLTKNSSPFVIALAKTNLNFIPHMMNSVILVSLISVANASIYCSSRTFVSLSNQQLAPKCFGYIDRKGRPIISILIAYSSGALAYISCISQKGANELFKWLLAMSALSSVFTWLSISLCHIRFRKALKVQNRSIEELSYKSQTGIIGSYIGLVSNCLILVVQFYIALYPIGLNSTKPQIVPFLNNYLAVLVNLLFFIGHKLYRYIIDRKLNTFVKLSEIDLDTGKDLRNAGDVEELKLMIKEEEEVRRSRKWYKRAWKIWC